MYAGLEPGTRRARYLSETIPAGPDAADRAEQARLRLIRTVDQREGPRLTATLDELVTRHIAMMPLAGSTKDNYRGYHRKHIHPLLGQHPIGHVTAEMLDEFYAELARCRDHCTQPETPHGRHQKHQCRPLAAASIRKIHFLLSTAYRSAIRWDWTTDNPTEQATPPPQPRPCPRPPTPSEVARILAEAWNQVEPLVAVAIWIAITTGARRGELCALRWSDFDADRQVIHTRASISHTTNGLVEKTPNCTKNAVSQSTVTQPNSWPPTTNSAASAPTPTAIRFPTTRSSCPLTLTARRAWRPRPWGSGSIASNSLTRGQWLTRTARSAEEDLEAGGAGVLRDPCYPHSCGGGRPGSSPGARK